MLIKRIHGDYYGTIGAFTTLMMGDKWYRENFTDVFFGSVYPAVLARQVMLFTPNTAEPSPEGVVAALTFAFLNEHDEHALINGAPISGLNSGDNFWVLDAIISPKYTKDVITFLREQGSIIPNRTGKFLRLNDDGTTRRVGTIRFARSQDTQS